MCDGMAQIVFSFLSGFGCANPPDMLANHEISAFSSKAAAAAEAVVHCKTMCIMYILSYEEVVAYCFLSFLIVAQYSFLVC